MNEENLQQTPPQTDSPDRSSSVYRAGEQQRIGIGERVAYFILSLAPTILCWILQIIIISIVWFLVIFSALESGELDMDSSFFTESWNLLRFSSHPTLRIFLYQVIGLFVFGLWYYLSFRKPRPTVKATIRKTTLPAILVAVICGVALCFFANGTAIIGYIFRPEIAGNYSQHTEQAGIGVNILAIFSSVILAPIGEEFSFRGLTLKFAKKSFGKFWLANLLQAFLFGASHGNWVQGIHTFFIGLVLCCLAERYQTLLPCIVLHFVVNFSSATWVRALIHAVSGNEFPSLFAGLAMMIVSAIVVVALLYKTKKPKGLYKGLRNS